MLKKKKKKKQLGDHVFYAVCVCVFLCWQLCLVFQVYQPTLTCPALFLCFNEPTMLSKLRKGHVDAHGLDLMFVPFTKFFRICTCLTSEKKEQLVTKYFNFKNDDESRNVFRKQPNLIISKLLSYKRKKKLGSAQELLLCC